MTWLQGEFCPNRIISEGFIETLVIDNAFVLLARFQQRNASEKVVRTEPILKIRHWHHDIYFLSSIMQIVIVPLDTVEPARWVLYDKAFN
ncbi:MAG: hypothetical protein PHY54_15435 [Methylococcales bacterium]|nr:hypothetical protein [Methylococcales bacterium]